MLRDRARRDRRHSIVVVGDRANRVYLLSLSVSVNVHVTWLSVRVRAELGPAHLKL